MIERATDYRRVRRLVDANPAEGLGKWRLVVSIEYFYLIEVFYIGGTLQDVGLWCFEPDSRETYKMHAAMGPMCRGKRAVQSGLGAIEWMFDNTYCQEILAPVPIHLKHAQRIPRAAGLTFVGEHEGAKVYRVTREQFQKMEMTA